jgi:hypothetical protein
MILSVGICAPHIAWDIDTRSRAAAQTAFPIPMNKFFFIHAGAFFRLTVPPSEPDLICGFSA